MKTILLPLIIIVCIGCAENCMGQENNMEKYKKHYTNNPNNPWIYIKGWDRIEFVDVTISENNEPSSQLRFYNTFISVYTGQLMFEKYKKWDLEIWNPFDRKFYVKWSGVQLFDDENVKFDIYTSGGESREEIYSSVIVKDVDGNDCLSKEYYLRDKLVKYFSDGIEKVGNGNRFYRKHMKAFMAHWTKKDM